MGRARESKSHNAIIGYFLNVYQMLLMFVNIKSYVNNRMIEMLNQIIPIK